MLNAPRLSGARFFVPGIFNPKKPKSLLPGSTFSATVRTAHATGRCSVRRAHKMDVVVGRVSAGKGDEMVYIRADGNLFADGVIQVAGKQGQQLGAGG